MSIKRWWDESPDATLVKDICEVLNYGDGPTFIWKTDVLSSKTLEFCKSAEIQHLGKIFRACDLVDKGSVDHLYCLKCFAKAFVTERGDTLWQREERASNSSQCYNMRKIKDCT